MYNFQQTHMALNKLKLIKISQYNKVCENECGTEYKIAILKNVITIQYPPKAEKFANFRS